MAASELPSFLLFLGCLEVFAVINGSLLFSAGLTTSIPKYLGRELSLSLLLLLPVLLPGRLGSAWSVLLYIILALFTCANWIHAALFASPLSSYIVSVFLETNSEETAGFFEQYASSGLLLRVLAVIALTLPLLLLSLKLRPRPLKGRYIILVVILFTVVSALLRHPPERMFRHNYVGDFFLSCLDEIRDRKAIRTYPLIPPSGIRSIRQEPRILIVVIGETAGRGHCSLYGYPRQTTPMLDQRKETLLIFTDVISSHNHTTAALEKALTFANHEGEPAQASIVDALKAGGFHTTAISNQPPLGENETIATLLLKRADAVHFLNRPNTNGFYGSSNAPYLDEKILDPLKQALARSGDIAIIIHLMGSHGPYVRRYPPDKARFFDQPPERVYGKLPLDKNIVQDINTYDNSIAYTDFILEAIFRLLENEKRPTALVYFSDHGEAVYEDGRFRGHGGTAPFPQMFEIPFLIWLSDSFKQAEPEFSKEIREYVNRPWQTDDLIYPLLHLAGIALNRERPEKDILSPGFVPEKRIMIGWDYDEFFRKSGKKRTLNP